MMSDNFAEGYAIGRDSNGYNNGMWGGDWAWWIVLLLLFGWGNNGWGNNSGYGGGHGQFGYDIGKLATTNDVAVGFNNSAVLSSLNDLKLGQAGIQQTLCQGFNGVNTAVLQAQNATEKGFAQAGYQIADCCCQTQRAIDGVNYNMAKNACDIQNSINMSARDIIDGQRASTDAILGFLTQEKISSLQAENAQLTAQLSQNAQTRTLIDTLRPCPMPAYITCSPYESVYGTGRNGYGYGYGCGCGCGCGC